MGGRNSKPAERSREISANLKLQCDANCNPSATSQQRIELEGVTIRARDNCSINFINYATVDTSCDMNSIIDAVAKVAVQADESFAKQLMDARDAAESSSADVHRQELNIQKSLKASCLSHANAQQTIKITGAVMECTGNSQITSGNDADVRATCLRTKLSEALDKVSGLDDSRLLRDRSSGGGGSGGGSDRDEPKVLAVASAGLSSFVLCAALLIIVVIMLTGG